MCTHDAQHRTNTHESSCLRVRCRMQTARTCLLRPQVSHATAASLQASLTPCPQPPPPHPAPLLPSPCWSAAARCPSCCSGTSSSSLPCGLSTLQARPGARDDKAPHKTRPSVLQPPRKQLRNTREPWAGGSRRGCAQRKRGCTGDMPSKGQPATSFPAHLRRLAPGAALPSPPPPAGPTPGRAAGRSGAAPAVAAAAGAPRGAPAAPTLGGGRGAGACRAAPPRPWGGCGRCDTPLALEGCRVDG